MCIIEHFNFAELIHSARVSELVIGGSWVRLLVRNIRTFSESPQDLLWLKFVSLQVKVERDDLTKELKRKDDTLEQKRQETSILSEQVEVSRRKSSEFIIGEEILLRDKCEKEASVRRLSTELTKSQQRNIEMDARVTSLEEKSETFKRERDHAKEQWRQSVKERKRLNREIAAIVQARDEAIQKCFSTAEQLEKMKEEYNHLLNRLAKTGLNGNDSGELSIPCSLKECKFCENDAVDAAMVRLQLGYSSSLLKSVNI